LQNSCLSLPKYSTKIFTEAVYGGAPIERQINALDRPTHIVVATPGRLIDLVKRKAVDLSNVKTIILDEADEMLDMGFKEELDAILKETPESRQTLLFSATISRSIHNIAKNYMKDTKEISVGEKNTGAEKCKP